MPEIDKYDLYDIECLIDVWKSGWREFAQLGKKLSITRYRGFADPGNLPSSRIKDGFREIYCDMVHGQKKNRLPDFFDILTLAVIPKNEGENQLEGLPKYWFKTGDAAEVSRRKFIGKITNAFANSVTIREAFYKIGTEKRRNKVIRFHLGTRRLRNKVIRLRNLKLLETEMMTKIQGHWAEAMKWLDYGLQGEVECEEAYWNCVWLYLEKDIQVMSEIKNHINSNIPLTDEQCGLLNRHMSSGHPKGCYRKNTDGSEIYELGLKPKDTNKKFSNTEDSCLTTIASKFWAQPAFRLAGELQRNCSKPRFIRYCRAPSCGKKFYTGHKNATCCPGSQGNKKNKCALEWIRYKRYLQKIGENSEENWDNLKLKEQFVSYDNS